MGARREAREALAAAGLRARKRWGQHFLCDGAVARRIVDTAGLGAGDAVLEIGPGLGALTDELARRAARLYLVEIDPRLAARLADRFAGDARVHVLVGDVLEMPLADVIAEPSLTVVANLPYGVATPIVFRLLELRPRFPRAVVMLQREMAERLVARAGTPAYGAASVLLQAFAEARIVFRVSRRSFFPTPDVDSAVLELRIAARPRVDLGDPERFRAVVRAAFGQRRKMLRNALRTLAPGGETAARVERALRAAGIDTAARAETLDLAAFARLARAFGA